MTHASVFSGIGGPEVAAAMLGWENAFHCEINPFGRRVLEYWFPDSISYEDITKTSFKEWRGRIDVLSGGFPCQPFSYAGKRGGREDERYLWPEMLRAIDEIRPTWVIGENVAGLATMVEGWVLTELGCSSALFKEDNSVHDYLLEQTYTIEKIAKELEGIGYSVQPVLIPAAAVGAPHRRDRIFIIAHLDAPNTEGVFRDGGCDKHEGKSGRKSFSEPGNGSRRDAASHADGRGGGEIPSPVHSGEPDGDKPFSDGGERNASDAYGKGLQESQQPGWGENCEEEGAGMDNRTVRSCRYEDAADTFRKRLSAALQSGLYGPQERDGEGRSAVQLADDAWAKGTWWDNFPTVAPVHAGNDGLPIRMDGISLPASMQPRNYRNSDRQRFNFGRWRTESLKAYGNAIVPQVMYRIFQMINEL